MEREKSFVPAESPSKPEVKRLTPEEQDKAEGITPAFSRAAEMGLYDTVEEELEKLEDRASQVLPEKTRDERPRERYHRLKALDEKVVSEFNELTRQHPELIPKDFLKSCNGLNRIKELLVEQYNQTTKEQGPASPASKVKQLRIINRLSETLETKIFLLQEKMASVQSRFDNGSLEEEQ